MTEPSAREAARQELRDRASESNAWRDTETGREGFAFVRNDQLLQVLDALEAAEKDKRDAEAWVLEHAYVEYDRGQVLCRDCHNPFGPVRSHQPGCYVAELESKQEASRER